MKRGLGKSLDEIISAGVKRPGPPEGIPSLKSPVEPPSSGGVRMVPLDRVRANPRQPRREFAEAALQELVASIREHGILQPITVRQGADAGFEIIAGERRWRAAQLAGLTEIPVLVKLVDDAGSLELALVENLQREDLNPIEEARGYRDLADNFHLTQEEIAAKVGKDRATVANALRLLQLPEKLHQYLVHGQLSAGHAKAILPLTSEELQVRVAESVIKDGLSVRATENLIRVLSAHRKPKLSKPRTAAVTETALKAIEDALQQKLGTRVRLIGKGDKGRIEIEYFTKDDLDRLLQIFGVTL